MQSDSGADLELLEAGEDGGFGVELLHVAGSTLCEETFCVK